MQGKGKWVPFDAFAKESLDFSKQPVSGRPPRPSSLNNSTGKGAPNALEMVAEEAKRERILGQIEYYFSPDNLAKDLHLRKQVPLPRSLWYLLPEN